MSRLDQWLQEATRHLSAESAVQVRSEIREHYELAREAAMAAAESAGGNNTGLAQADAEVKVGPAKEDEADRLVVAALGDARVANRKYRAVLLTASEARMLARASREIKAVASRPWLQALLLAVPITALTASAGLMLSGSFAFARTLLAGGIATSLLFAGVFVPRQRPFLANILRCAKWAAMVFLFTIAFDSSWLMIACLWPLAHVEWNMATIRHKLPIAQWPRSLYF
ncbi:MAG TPA: hypothetical protein VKZ53_14850 [Candidatus Angelobacter sp.]|nr:hypothetical protein [Candidatus Angelobacter sp.]